MPYVQAKSATRDAWMAREIEGAPRYGRFYVNGVDVYLAIQEGDVEQFDFPIRYHRHNGGRRIGDLVWTMSAAKIASPRLVEALTRVGATGFRTFPIEVTGAAAAAMQGYVGFAVTSDSPANDLWNERAWNSYGFHICDRVFADLVAAGIDGFEITDPNPIFDPPLPEIGSVN